MMKPKVPCLVCKTEEAVVTAETFDRRRNETRCADLCGDCAHILRRAVINGEIVASGHIEIPAHADVVSFLAIGGGRGSQAKFYGNMPPRPKWPSQVAPLAIETASERFAGGSVVGSCRI